MVDLDSISLHETLDRSGMRHLLRNLAFRCQEAWDITVPDSVSPNYAEVDRIIIVGMGGSAIAGDFVSSLSVSGDSLPVLVVRDFDLPSTLDSNSLVFACSYSGNTSETLSVFNQAVKTEAKVIALTGGGLLKEQADQLGVPVISFAQDIQPRNASGPILMSILKFLASLDLLPTTNEQVRSSLEILQANISDYSEGIPLSRNYAKQLATRLHERLIVVYGVGPFSSVARRWKTQFNENSKNWAFFEVVPEVLHNGVEGMGIPANLKTMMVSLILQPMMGDKTVDQASMILLDLLNQNQIPVEIINGGNSTLLSQLLTTLILGDYVSYYLALLNNVDPAPVPNIEAAKHRLSEAF